MLQRTGSTKAAPMLSLRSFIVPTVSYNLAYLQVLGESLWGDEADEKYLLASDGVNWDMI